MKIAPALKGARKSECGAYPRNSPSVGLPMIKVTWVSEMVSCSFQADQIILINFLDVHILQYLVMFAFSQSLLKIRSRTGINILDSCTAQPKAHLRVLEPLLFGPPITSLLADFLTLGSSPAKLQSDPG